MSLEQTLERIAVALETLANAKETAPTVEHVYVEPVVEPTEPVAEASPEKKKRKTRKKKAKAEPKPEPEPEVEVEEEPEPMAMEASASAEEASGATMDELEAELRINVATLNGSEWALNLLREFGATKLSEIDPTDVGKIYNRLVAKNNE